MKGSIDLERASAFLRDFAVERDWEQFHTPKNLAMALGAEAGELIEIFQWLTPADSESPNPATRNHVGEELADVLQYAVRLADLLEIDLEEAFWKKLRANEKRYPADEVRGNAEKRP